MHAMFDPELCHHTSEGKGIMMVSASKEIRKQKMHTNFSLFILFFSFRLVLQITCLHLCTKMLCFTGYGGPAGVPNGQLAKAANTGKCPSTRMCFVSAVLSGFP